MAQEHVDRIREGIHKMSFDLVELFGDGSPGDPSSSWRSRASWSRAATW